MQRATLVRLVSVLSTAVLSISAIDVSVVVTRLEHRADRAAEKRYVAKQLQADGLPTFDLPSETYAPDPTPTATTLSVTGEVDVGLTKAGAPAPADWTLQTGGTCTGSGVMAVVRENATVVVSDASTHAVLARTTLGPGYEGQARSGVANVCAFDFGFDGLPQRASYTFQVAGLDPVTSTAAQLSGIGTFTIDAYHP